MEEITSKLNLSKTSQKIFSITLMKGCVSAGTIATTLGYELKTVKKGLKDLENKQLIRQISGVTPRYIPLPPIQGLIDHLDQIWGDINGYVKSIQDLNTTKSNKYDKSSQKLLNRLTKEFGLLTEELKEKKLKISDGLDLSYESAKKEIESSKDAFTNNYDQAIKNVTSSLKSEINKQENVVLDNFQEIKTNFKEKTGNISNDLDKGFLDHFGKIKQDLENLDTKNVGNVESKLSEFKHELNENLLKIVADFEKIDRNNTELLQKNESEIKILLDETKLSLSNVLKESLLSAQNAISTVKTDSEENFKKFIAVDSSTSTDFSESITESYNILNSRLNGIIDSLQSNIINQTEYQYKEAKRRLSDKQNELQENLSKSVTTATADLSNLIDDINIEISNAVDALNKQMKEGENYLINSLQQKLTHQTTSFTEIMEKFLQDFKQMGIAFEIELKQEISESITETQSNTMDSLEEFLSTINSAKKSVKTLFQKKKDADIELMKENMKILEKEISLFDGVLKTYINETIDEGSTQINSTIQKYEEKSKELMDNRAVSFKQSIENTGSIINDKSTNVENEIESKLLSSLEETGQKMDKISTKFTEDVSTSQEISQKTFSDAISNLTDMESNYVQSLENEITNLGLEFHEIIDQQINILNDFRGISTALLLEKIEEYEKTIESTLNNIQVGFKELSTSKNSEFDLSISNIVDQHFSKLSDMTVDLMGAFQAANVDSNNFMMELENVIINTIVNIKESTEKGIDSGKSLLDNQLGEILTKSIETIGSLKNITDQPIETLKSAWEIMNSVELINSEQTWHLMGNQEITSYINEMILNAKKNLIVVLPNVDDIPLKKLANKKIQMQIVADIPNGLDPELIEKLKDKGSEILNYKNKDLIAVVRDGEELLFAPVTPDDKYTTAFLSEKQEFIEIMKSMIIEHWEKNAQAI